MSRLVCAVAVLAALVVATGATARSSWPTRPAAVETNGTLRGSVASSLRPSAGAVTTVRAIDARNGTTAAGGRVRAGGGYRLAAPPGIYLVVVEKVSRRARPAIGFGRLVRVRGGHTSTLRTINPGSAAARRALASIDGVDAALGSSGFHAAAAASQPAVAVRYFTGSGPNAIVGKGLTDMLVTDLWGSPCYKLVNWELRAAMLAEIRLQQSTQFDPSTRVTPNWTQPTIFVEGSVSTTLSSISWNIRMREIATGRIIGSDSGRAADVLAAEVGIARRLRQQLEKELCLRGFTGSFSGRTRETAGPQTLDFSFTGTVRFASGAADSKPGFTSYSIEKIDYRTTITLSGMCTGTDTQSASLGKNDEPGNVLHLANKATPGKGRLYEVNFTVQRPAPGTFTVTCSGTSVDYLWAPVAQVITAPAQFFTDANATRLQGTHTLPGSLTYTWNLARSS